MSLRNYVLVLTLRLSNELSIRLESIPYTSHDTAQKPRDRPQWKPNDVEVDAIGIEGSEAACLKIPDAAATNGFIYVSKRVACKQPCAFVSFWSWYENLDHCN